MNNDFSEPYAQDEGSILFAITENGKLAIIRSEFPSAEDGLTLFLDSEKYLSRLELLYWVYKFTGFHPSLYVSGKSRFFGN